MIKFNSVKLCVKNIMITKEQSVITKIMKVFCGKEKILLQHSVSSKINNLYFPEHKLAIEIDEKGHKDRDEKINCNTESNRRTSL